MKYLLTFLIAFAGIFGSIRDASAQTPYVDLIYAGDSSMNAYCTLPDTVSFFYYGYAPGYPANDSLFIEINFGDGTTTSYYLPLIQGTTFYDDVLHIYTLPGAYAVQFIATGPDGSSDTLVDQTVLVSSSCADISGRVYMDTNANCNFDTGEFPYTTWVTASYNGNVIAAGMNNALGEYYISVPSGYTYTVEIYNTSLLYICPVSGSYTVTTLPSSGNDFALTCNPVFDYTGDITGWGFRVNDTTRLWVSAFNTLLSCSAPDAILTLTLDPMLSYAGSANVPVSVTSTEVVFNAGPLLGNMSGYQTWIDLITDPSAQLGDTLCLTLTIDPQLTDSDPTNNVITLCLPVRNSWDPNEKHEAHAGTGTASVAPGTTLDYTIFFQNVGNDDAYKVTVIDELDPSLDLSTLKIKGYSHTPSIYLLNSTLKFEFNNINLPAASVNEPMSHGYVSYSIDHVVALPNGTAINNDAEIFFDFNQPIITNTVTNILDQSLGLPENLSANVSIYPNPATDYIIVNGIGGSAKLFISDVTGRQVLNSLVNGNQRVGLKNFNPGVYMITLEMKDEIINSRFVVK